jgi:hypothetical protein
MITASFKPSFAASRPATSSHLTFGFSDTIADERASCSFLSSSSLSPPFYLLLSAVADAPPPPVGGGVSGAIYYSGAFNAFFFIYSALLNIDSIFSE